MELAASVVVSVWFLNHHKFTCRMVYSPDRKGKTQWVREYGHLA